MVATGLHEIDGDGRVLRSCWNRMFFFAGRHDHDNLARDAVTTPGDFPSDNVHSKCEFVTNSKEHLLLIGNRGEVLCYESESDTWFGPVYPPAVGRGARAVGTIDGAWIGGSEGAIYVRTAKIIAAAKTARRVITSPRSENASENWQNKPDRWRRQPSPSCCATSMEIVSTGSTTIGFGPKQSNVCCQTPGKPMLALRVVCRATPLSSLFSGPYGEMRESLTVKQEGTINKGDCQMTFLHEWEIQFYHLIAVFPNVTCEQRAWRGNVMNKSKVAGIFVAMVAIAAVGMAHGENPATLRCAVIGSTEIQQTGLSDLVTSELTQRKDLVLVEREGFAAVLAEKELHALFQGERVQQLRVARLANADLLIMLSLQKNQRKRFVQLVIVDCRYAARLHTSFFAYFPEKRGEICTSCVEKVVATRSRFAQGVQQIIAVTPFLSQNLHYKYDHLQEGFRELLQNALLHVPGTAVLELEEVQAIAREMQLAGEAHTAAQVPMTVNGSFEMNPGNGTDDPTLTMTLRIIVGDKELRTFQTENLSLTLVVQRLVTSVPKAIVQLRQKVVVDSISAEEQIKTLSARAAEFAAAGAAKSSVPLRQAVLLMDPHLPAERLLMLTEATPDLINDDARLEHIEFLLRNREVDRLQAELLLGHVASKGLYFNKASYEAHTLDRQTRKRLQWEAYVALARQVGQLPLECRGPQVREAMDLFKAREHGFVDAWQRVKRERAYEWTKGVITQAFDSGRDERPFRNAAGTMREKTCYTPQALERLKYVVSELVPPESVPGDAMGQLLFRRFPDCLCSGQLDTNAVRGLWRQLSEMTDERIAICGRCGLAVLAYCESFGENLNLSVRDDVDVLLEEVDTLTKHGVPESYVGYFRRHLQKFHQQVDERLKAEKQLAMEAGLNPANGLGIGPWGFRETKGADTSNLLAFEAIDEIPAPPRFFGQCNDDFDLIECFDWVALMRKPGKLDRIFSPIGIKDRIIAARYDGANIWVATLASQVVVISPEGQTIAIFDEQNGLPPYHQLRGKTFAEGGMSRCMLAPISPGKCLVIGIMGMQRRLWLARLTANIQGEDLRSGEVKVFHKATKVSTEEGLQKDDDPTEYFEPTWIRQYQEPGSQGRQLILLGRKYDLRRLMINPKRRPLVIDPSALSAEIFPIPYDSLRTLDTQTDYVCHNHHLLVHDRYGLNLLPPKPVNGTSEWKPKMLNASRNSETHALVVLNGTIYKPGRIWHRIDPETWKIEQINTTPFSQEYTFARYATSAHYGIVAWNRRGMLHKVILNPGESYLPDLAALYPKVAVEKREAHHAALQAIRNLGGRTGENRFHVNASPQGYWRSGTAILLDSNWRGGNDSLEILADVADLGEVRLVQTDIDDEGLRHLAGLSHLSSLTIVQTRVTDEGLRRLAEFRDLVELHLAARNAGTDIGDAGLATFAHCRHLQHVMLCGQGFTATSADTLAQLPALKQVNLYYTRIPNHAIAKVIDSVGSCRVERK